MSDETQTSEKPDNSTIFGVSVRAWLALMTIGTVCTQTLATGLANVWRGESTMIEEPIYSLSLIAIGYYLGQKNITKI